MRNILCIFGFCCLLAMGFTACQEDEALIVKQVNKDNLEKKRDSKKHPKLEYITSGVNNSLKDADKSEKLECSYQIIEKTLHVFMKCDSKEKVSVYFKDELGETMYTVGNLSLRKEKEIVISPAIHFPYVFVMAFKSGKVIGLIDEE